MTHVQSRNLALGGLIICLTLYTLTQLGYAGDNPIGTTSRATAPLIVPSPYAFAIWGPIYLGLIVFPIFQLIKKREEHPAWIELRAWYAANVVANGVWLVLASYDFRWSTVLVISFMLVSLFRINQLLLDIKQAHAPLNFIAERLVFGLYFAWITLATVLNVSTDLKSSGWDGGAFGEVNWTIVMMVVAAVIAAFTAWKFRNAPYALVVVWAFVAIARKHLGVYPIISYVAIGVVVIFAALATTILINRAGKLKVIEEKHLA